MSAMGPYAKEKLYGPPKWYGLQLAKRVEFLWRKYRYLTIHKLF